MHLQFTFLGPVAGLISISATTLTCQNCHHNHHHDNNNSRCEHERCVSGTVSGAVKEVSHALLLCLQDVCEHKLICEYVRVAHRLFPTDLLSVPAAFIVPCSCFHAIVTTREPNQGAAHPAACVQHITAALFYLLSGACMLVCNLHTLCVPQWFANNCGTIACKHTLRCVWYCAVGHMLCFCCTCLLKLSGCTCCPMTALDTHAYSLGVCSRVCVCVHSQLAHCSLALKKALQLSGPLFSCFHTALSHTLNPA